MKKVLVISILIASSSQLFAQGSNSGGVGYVKFQSQDPSQLTFEDCKILNDLSETEICRGNVTLATLDNGDRLLFQKADELMTKASLISSENTIEASKLLSKVPAIQLVLYKTFRMRQNLEIRDSKFSSEF